MNNYLNKNPLDKNSNKNTINEFNIFNLIDIRLESIEKNLRNIKNILAIVSPKGGVGKSTFIFLLSNYLHYIKKEIGILDLDLTNPCLDVIFNAKNVKFQEHNGIIPPTLFNNIKLLSINQFIKPDEILPLRGNEITQVILELLTITNWGNLDYLLIDTPPTITDTFLDLLRFIPFIKLILITDNSTLSLNSITKFIKIIKEKKLDILFIVFNQLHKYSYDDNGIINNYLKFLTNEIPNYIYLDYIENIENYYGKMDINILKKEIYEKFQKIF
ncbi:MAG: P-loop NTPase [bacterium]|nr:P-loop NTPase [bacterium]